MTFRRSHLNGVWKVCVWASYESLFLQSLYVQNEFIHAGKFIHTDKAVSSQGTKIMPAKATHSHLAVSDFQDKIKSINGKWLFLLKSVKATLIIHCQQQINCYKGAMVIGQPFQTVTHLLSWLQMRHSIPSRTDSLWAAAVLLWHVKSQTCFF